MIYAVGDIHGQHTMLQALLSKLFDLPLKGDDTLVFLGDYIDRGEDSRAVIETLIGLGQRHPDTQFLRGNHEQMMLDVCDAAASGPPDDSLALREGKMLTWLQNGGAETLLSYRASGFENWYQTVPNIRRLLPNSLAEFRANFTHWLDAIPTSHLQFLRATQLEYITDHYHFVHAGLLEPGQSWESEGWDMDPRLWIRQPFLTSRADYDGRIVVFGHTPQRGGRPLVRRNKICLDTGAVFGGPLTAGIFEPDRGGKEAKPPRFLRVAYADAGSAHREGANRRASSARSSRK